MPSSTIAHTLFRADSLPRQGALLVVANLLLIACAYIAIDLPFSPVPITGQTFGIMLIAIVLGRTRAVAAVIAYLAEGALGLPVFAGGAAGPHVFVGPTGGYLVAFLPAAWIIGSLADQGWDRSYWLSLAAMFLGNVVVFVCGLAWLTTYVPSEGILVAGLYPFLPGAVIKAGVASAISPSLWRLLGRDR